MFQKGAHEEAIRDFSKVIELHSLATVAFNNRGYNYQQIGKNAKAIVDYNKVIELTPDDALAHQNRARLLAVCCLQTEKTCNPKLAIESATKACEPNQFDDLSDKAGTAAAHTA